MNDNIYETTESLNKLTYLAQDGTARASLEVTAHEVKFLSGRGEGDAQGTSQVENNADIPF